MVRQAHHDRHPELSKIGPVPTVDRRVVPRHTGFASLPLHGGKAPAWLFGRMVRLSREIVIYLASEHGTRDVLRRLSDPFWFQAFGCVLGFDWHSSGVTTTVCGAVKEGLKDIDRGPRVLRGRRQGQRVAQDPATDRRRLRPDRSRGAAAGVREQDRRQGRQRRRPGRLSALSPRVLLHGRGRLVRRAAGDERCEPDGAPLSLAVRACHELRRRTARRRSAAMHAPRR